jgi:hypothetical protein
VGCFHGRRPHNSPLTFAFQQKRDKCSPRQFNHLDFISQFTTDIRHISGQKNVVADALSRVKSVTAPPSFDALATAQTRDDALQTLLTTIHIAFVGCHGNPVYPAVTWIPIYVSVTWSPVFPPCGMFPWKAPTRPLGRPRHGWVDDIEMNLGEISCGDVDWIGLAQERDRWRALANVVMNFQVP